MAENFGNEVIALLHSIIERCKLEKDQGGLLVPLDDYFERVSYYTAYPMSLIKEITCITDVNDQKSNLEKHILLMMSMKSVLQLKTLPTLTTLYTAFKQNQKRFNTSNGVVISNLKNFCKLLNRFKYGYRKTTENTLVVIENPQVTFERYQYLKMIKNLRGSDKIFYIDERCFDADMSYGKPIANKKFSETEYYTLFLLISSKGHEQCLFTSNCTEGVFKQWIENIVLPVLPPSSVVVMTNSYLHGVEKNLITRYHTKTQMMQWLRVHDIPHSPDMCKADLFDLIKKCTTRTKLNNIAKILISYGHKVIHLPSTFEDISPIQYLWEQIQIERSFSNNVNLYDAKNKLYTYIKTLEHSYWETFFSKSNKAEDEIYTLDKEIEDNYDFICKLDDHCN